MPQRLSRSEVKDQGHIARPNAPLRRRHTFQRRGVDAHLFSDDYCYRYIYGENKNILLNTSTGALYGCATSPKLRCVLEVNLYDIVECLTLDSQYRGRHVSADKSVPKYRVIPGAGRRADTVVSFGRRAATASGAEKRNFNHFTRRWMNSHQLNSHPSVV